MNRHELVIGFVKSVLSLILTKEFPESEYKRQRREYFLESHRKIKQGVIPNKEIASEAIRYLIKIGRVSTDSQLSTTFRLPFFKKNVRNPTPLFDFLRTQKRPDPSIDLSSLSREEYEAYIREEVWDKVQKERTSEIDDLIKERKMVYESLPSVLDETEYAEPEVVDDDIDGEDKYMPWWKKLNLVGDPFPTIDGLRDISESFYERPCRINHLPAHSR